MIDAVIDCQTKLIAALDAGDADAMLLAANALAMAVEALRKSPEAAATDQLTYGLRQSEAARIRVKYLTAWNRQKIDRFAKLRGQSKSNIYEKLRETV
jgi:hypothetical protein